MAEQDLNTSLNLNTNFPTVVNKVVKSIDSLENSLQDLAGVFEDLAKYDTRAADSLESFQKAAGKSSQSSSNLTSSVESLRKAMRTAGSEGDAALKKLDFSKISLKSLSGAEIQEFNKRLREAGTNLAEFLQNGNINLNFRPALEQLNELQKLLGKPISTPEMFAGTEEIFAQMRNLNTQLRTEIEGTLSELRVPESAFSTVGELRSELLKLSESTGTQSLGLFADLDKNRKEAELVVNTIDELRKKLIAIGPAAQSGNDDAIAEFRQLSSELDKATVKAEKFTAKLRGGVSQFGQATAGSNRTLATMGLKPITIEDIFPSEEQRKIEDVRRRIDQAVGESVRSGAVRDTLNTFLRKPIQDIDKNVVSLTTHLPRLRYALYDVSNTFGILGGTITAAAGATFKFAADFERQFADVARTTGVAGIEAAKLKEELITLSQEIPVAFGDIAEIATLAGQLNIATANVEEFTATVAKFAATTDVTTEAAATAFGRLDQLVDGVNGQFEKLGSSILAVGVNAVATESDIIAISSQIASVANIAGFSASELIGFSSALASVGTRPELARGTFTRLFTEIQQSVAEGGDQLDAFARTAGQSQDDFVAAWGAGSGADQVVAVLEGLNAAGKNADQVLAQLGITSVRDVPTLLKLAQSIDEVKKQIQIANIGFIEGTELQDQYSVITATVTEKIELLKNNFAALLDTIGAATGPLGFVIDILNQLIRGFERLIDNPINQFIVGVATVITGLLGVFTLMGAALARVVGGLTGFATASIETREAVGLMRTSVDGLNASLITNASVTSTATTGTKAHTAASRVNAGAIGAEVIAQDQYNAALVRGAGAQGGLFKSMGRGLVATRLFTGGLVGLGITVGSILLLELGKWIYDQGVAMEWWGDKTEQLTDKLGEVGPFIDAVKKDTADFEAGLQDASDGLILFSGEVDNGNVSLSERGKVIAVVTGQEDLLKQSVDGSTTAIENQTLAIGRNTQALMKEKIAQELLNQATEAGTTASSVKRDVALARGETPPGQPSLLRDIARAEELRGAAGAQVGIASLFEIISDPALNEQLKQSGFNFQDWVNAVVSGNEEAANSIAQKLGPAASQLAAILERKNDPEAYGDAIAYLNGVVEFGEQGLSSYAQAGSDLHDALKELVFQETVLGDAFAETSDAAENVGEALKNAFSEAYSGINAQRQMEESVRSLGAAFAEESADIVANSQEMQSAIQSIIDTDPENAIDNLNSFYNAVIEGGYASKEQLEILGDQIIETYRIAAQTQLEFLQDQKRALQASVSFAGSSIMYSKTFNDQVVSLNNQISAQEEVIANIDKTILKTGDAGKYAGYLADGYKKAKDEAAGAADATKDLADNAEEAVRTLLDYANDLEAVFSRAFDIRFGTTSAIDRVAESWQSLRDDITGAQEAVDDLLKTQQELSADRAIKEYFLSVAEAYDDQLRASKLRAEISDLDAKAAENQAKLTEQGYVVDATTGDGTVNQFSLTDDSPIARRNRAALTGLVSEYQSYIKSLAESGASQDELAKATERARKEFIAQATDLGYAEEDVMQYAAAFDDLTFAINNVPRDVTIEANVNPALTALKELQAQQQRNIDKAYELNNALGSGPSSSSSSTSDPNNTDTDRATALSGQLAEAEQRKQNAINGIIAANAEIARLNALIASSRSITAIDSYTAAKNTQVTRRSNWVTARNNAQADIDRIKAQMWTGGFTGQGGKYEPAGIVHKGEYVVPKNMVNQATGLPKPQFLEQMRTMAGYYMGGAVGGGGAQFPDAMVVELSPYDRQLLENAGNVQLRLDGRVVAQSTNRNNISAAQRGSN